MSDSSLAGKTALVTGASSGLGVDIARELARRGCHLVLVARREDRLKQVQAELQGQHGIRAMTVALDLGDPQAPQILYDHLKTQKTPVDLLVNNAGLGVYGTELDIPWERTRQLLMLDIVALTHLTKLFARDMVARGNGYILQVASAAAFQPVPTYAAYAAAKAYVRSFSQALNVELQGTGVSCTALCPGVTATEFFDAAGDKGNARLRRILMMSSPQVAAVGVRGMLERRSSVVAGWLNWLFTLLTGISPDWLNARIARELFRN